MAGVRVLDLTRLLPGPFASLLLVEQGAQVDRVDDPESADYLRLVPPILEAEQSARFVALNRGKRSVSLRLRSEPGRAAFLRLLSHYDVLIEQFRPGVLEAILGVSIATLRAQHPHLIVCSISGFGQTGIDAGRAGHDLTYLARAGILSLTGGTHPTVPAAQNADIMGALYAVVAIQGALLARRERKGGAHLDISLTEAAITSLAFVWGGALAGESPKRGGDTLTGGIAPYRTYETKDGRFVALAALEPKFWLRLNAGLGREPSLSDLVPGPHQEPLMHQWEDVFRLRTLDEWREFSRAYDVCLEPVLTPAEVLRDPHLNDRAVFGTRGFRTPLTAGTTEAPAPSAGEHTHRILREAGFAEAEIAALQALPVK